MTQQERERIQASIDKLVHTMTLPDNTTKKKRKEITMAKKKSNAREITLSFGSDVTVRLGSAVKARIAMIHLEKHPLPCFNLTRIKWNVTGFCGTADEMPWVQLEVLARGQIGMSGQKPTEDETYNELASWITKEIKIVQAHMEGTLMDSPDPEGPFLFGLNETPYNGDSPPYPPGFEPEGHGPHGPNALHQGASRLLLQIVSTNSPTRDPNSSSNNTPTQTKAKRKDNTGSSEPRRSSRIKRNTDIPYVTTLDRAMKVMVYEVPHPKNKKKSKAKGANKPTSHTRKL